MATTARGVPYPTPGDRADVPGDIRALAEWVDAHSSPGATLTPDPDHPGFFLTS